MSDAPLREMKDSGTKVENQATPNVAPAKSGEPQNATPQSSSFLEEVEARFDRRGPGEHRIRRNPKRK